MVLGCAQSLPFYTQDFGDGPRGKLYKQQFDVTQRYILRKFPLQENDKALENDTDEDVANILDFIKQMKISRRRRFMSRLPLRVSSPSREKRPNGQNHTIPGTMYNTERHESKEFVRAHFKSRLPRLVKK